MPSAPKWSINVRKDRGKDKAYVVLSGIPLSKSGKEYSNIKRAEVGEYSDSIAIKLIFTPGDDGKRRSSFFAMAKYDWSNSHSAFREMVGMENEEKWVEKFNKTLETISQQQESHGSQDHVMSHEKEATTTPSTSQTTPAARDNDHDDDATRKRKSLAQITITPPTQSKKRNIDQFHSKEIEFQNKTSESEIGGQYYISVTQVELPPANRMLRRVDELFLTQLKANMEKIPNGSYEPLYLSVKDLATKSEFSRSEIHKYKYEVHGGTHNVLATKQLAEKYPENPIFKGRYARIFVGLNDEEALWIASRHNSSGCFRHGMTFQDEVAVAYSQLQCLGEKDSENNLLPTQQWRDSCSQILGKPKKNLTEVFTIAGLPEAGYKSFLTICQKYEKGKLKEQRALAKDLRGKPALKPSYIKCMSRLETSDRVALLEQVAKEEISLDELKNLSDNLKTIRPVQKIISLHLGKEWDVLEEKLGDKVNAEQLTRYSGKDEANLVFRAYLDYLHKAMISDTMETTSTISPNIICTEDGTKGVIHTCPDPLQLQQASYGQENGFSLALYRIPEFREDDKLTGEIGQLLDLMDRLHFGVRQVYNVAILGKVEDLVLAKRWLERNRGVCELGYICIKDASASGARGMIQAVEGFLVYHAAVGQRVLPDHFNFETGLKNYLSVDAANKDSQTCGKLVEMFSRPGDWILDINLPQVTGVASAITLKRNGLCLVHNNKEQSLAQRRLGEIKL